MHHQHHPTPHVDANNVLTAHAIVVCQPGAKSDPFTFPRMLHRFARRVEDPNCKPYQEVRKAALAKMRQEAAERAREEQEVKRYRKMNRKQREKALQAAFARAGVVFQ